MPFKKVSKRQILPRSVLSKKRTRQLSRVAFCPGLRFVPDCVLSKTAFCLTEDLILCFAKDKLCQTQNCVAFCLRLRFASEDYVLKNLAFCPKDLAICLKKILAFCYTRSCVLSKKTAICSRSIHRVLSSLHCVLCRSISQMHNNIMAAGSRDRPPMLAPGRYPQWRSRFLRYVDTIPNGEALRKFILSGRYKPTTVLVQAVEATDDSPAEFGKFTSLDGESMESYYTRFYKLMNEMIRNNLIVTTIHKGKEIAKPITLPSETASEEDSDPEQAQRDKDMQKNLALIAKYFKKIYKPTNNNLRTSSNSKKKNVDTSPRFKNVNQSRQFGNQRMVNVVGARENVGSKVVQQSGIQCFNCREYGHFAKECRKPKRVKDSAYHKEKMLLCKQADNTCLVETDDSNVIPDSPDMCENDIQNDQNDVESDDERVALANVKLDVNENKKIQKQLKKANTTLAQELKECKTILAETSKSLGESISVRDSCLVALQTKQAEFEKYKAFNDRTIDYVKLERKLNEALGQLAQKDNVIKEGLKTKAYELLVVKERHDELMKQSLLTKSHYEGLVKQKTKVITDLKLREEHDIEKMLLMEKQLKFLNEIVYKRSQSIQTIHMMAPKVPTYNGRPTYANLRYLKQAQYEIPCLYAFPYDQNNHANRLIPDGEETLALERESRSKLNKDLVRPYDYTTLNSLYEIFKPLTQEYKIQLAHANEIRRKMWRKYFVKSKPNIYKNVRFLPVSKSISKSRQTYNIMTNNINHFNEIVDNAWIKHSKE
nr:hypothetical protein [Tanacetum cinerariifolium]GEY89563.1 hypothetical protein [Tanacetum cinerariifolium]